jgi:hypothetical protein
MPTKKTFNSKSTLWRYSSDKSSWIFATLDGASRRVVDRLESKPAGWGSRRVEAKIGRTVWRTSIFPDKRAGWVLPVKAEVRRKESVDEGDKVTISLRIL